MSVQSLTEQFRMANDTWVRLESGPLRKDSQRSYIAGLKGCLSAQEQQSLVSPLSLPGLALHLSTLWDGKQLRFWSQFPPF